MNELCKTHVDSCRFCWMCRHICPIGNATGLERNTARARALGLSLVNRGTYRLEDVLDNIYECACCGGCTNDCATGWDPVMFIRAARNDAALEGKLPPYIMTLVENILQTGNAYGKTFLEDALEKAVKAHSVKTDILFFLGSDARYMAPQSAVCAIKAMEKTGVNFTVLADEKPSGAQLDFLIGATSETKNHMTACAAQLNTYQRVVAYDPSDLSLWKRRYPENGVDIAAKTVSFPAFLEDKLDSLKPVKQKKQMTYQDPFALSRELEETAPARNVISAYADLKEMLVHGKDAIWAGGILMGQWMPEVMRSVAEKRLENVKGVGQKTVVTASVSEYTALKSVKQTDVEILSLEELILG